MPKILRLRFGQFNVNQVLSGTGKTADGESLKGKNSFVYEPGGDKTSEETFWLA